MTGIIIDRTLPLVELRIKKNKLFLPRDWTHLRSNRSGVSDVKNERNNHRSNITSPWAPDQKIKTFFTKGLISLEVKPIGSIRCEQRLKQSSIGLYLRLNSRPKKLKLSLPLLEKQHWKQDNPEKVIKSASKLNLQKWNRGQIKQENEIQQTCQIKNPFNQTAKFLCKFNPLHADSTTQTPISILNWISIEILNPTLQTPQK
jgi:hypothetical protein